MTPRRALISGLTALALALLVPLASGCGESEESSASDGRSEAYGELLRGLKRAALANETYDFGQQVDELGKEEKAVLGSFCNLNWQIKVNEEAAKLKKHAYIVSRIKNFADHVPVGGYSPALLGAIDELEAVVDLRSLDGDLVRRYSKACYAR